MSNAKIMSARKKYIWGGRAAAVFKTSDMPPTGRYGVYRVGIGLVAEFETRQDAIEWCEFKQSQGGFLWTKSKRKSNG